MVSNSDVTKGQRLCHSIAHIRFHISLPLQLCLYILHRLRDIITCFPTFKEDTWLNTSISAVIYMHGLFCINQHIRHMKCLASPIRKIWLEAKICNGSRDPDQGLLLHPNRTWYRPSLPVCKIWLFEFQPFQRYHWGQQNLKWVT